MCLGTRLRSHKRVPDVSALDEGTELSVEAVRHDYIWPPSPRPSTLDPRPSHPEHRSAQASAPIAERAGTLAVGMHKSFPGLTILALAFAVNVAALLTFNSLALFLPILALFPIVCYLIWRFGSHSEKGTIFAVTSFGLYGISFIPSCIVVIFLLPNSLTAPLNDPHDELFYRTMFFMFGIGGPLMIMGALSIIKGWKMANSQK